MSTEKNSFDYTPPNQIDPQEIQFQSSIANGTFGNVCRATWRGVEVAVKYIKISNKPLDKINENFYREATLMAMCQSQYIVKLYGICSRYLAQISSPIDAPHMRGDLVQDGS